MPADDKPASGGSTGVAAAGRRKFVHRSDNTEIVTDGYMSAASAQAVLDLAFAEWGINATTDSQLDVYLGPIAQVLRQGTSAERDWSKVTFIAGGKAYNMSVLASETIKKDTSDNPMRVWARSYRKGEIPVRIYDMLRDPENTIIRQEAALDYMCSLDVVHLSFDTADAVVKYKGMTLSQSDRRVIGMNTQSKVRSSRSTHIGGTDGGSVQDMAAHSAAVTGGSVPPSHSTTIPAGKERAGFASVRV